jgi:hypothetical protein
LRSGKLNLLFGLFTITLSLVVSNAAFAQSSYGLGANLIYQSVETNNNGSRSDSTVISYDLFPGMLQSSGLLLGLSYSSWSQGSSTLNVTPNETYYGLGIGYITEGWKSYLGYIVGGNEVVDANITRQGASGFILVISYQWKFWNEVSIGPAIRYSSINMSQQSTSGVVSEIEYSQTRILPSIALHFPF